MYFMNRLPNHKDMNSESNNAISERNDTYSHRRAPGMFNCSKKSDMEYSILLCILVCLVCLVVIVLVAEGFLNFFLVVEMVLYSLDFLVILVAFAGNENHVVFLRKHTSSLDCFATVGYGNNFLHLSGV